MILFVSRGLIYNLDFRPIISSRTILKKNLAISNQPITVREFHPLKVAESLFGFKFWIQLFGCLFFFYFHSAKKYV